MHSLLSRLWNDEAGFVISSELVLVATILVIGMIVGLTTVRDQVVQELADVAGAISDINQSYSYSAVTGHTSRTAGSDFIDKEDDCDGPGQETAGRGSNCVNVNAGGGDEEGT
jgi:Flp pilus assembly pilin Flp